MYIWTSFINEFELDLEDFLIIESLLNNLYFSCELLFWICYLGFYKTHKRNFLYKLICKPCNLLYNFYANVINLYLLQISHQSFVSCLFSYVPYSIFRIIREVMFSLLLISPPPFHKKILFTIHTEDKQKNHLISMIFKLIFIFLKCFYDQEDN